METGIGSTLFPSASKFGFPNYNALSLASSVYSQLFCSQNYGSSVYFQLSARSNKEQLEVVEPKFHTSLMILSSTSALVLSATTEAFVFSLPSL